MDIAFGDGTLGLRRELAAMGVTLTPVSESGTKVDLADGHINSVGEFFFQWLAYRPSREIAVWNQSDGMVDVSRFSAEQIQQTLRVAEKLIAVDNDGELIEKFAWSFPCFLLATDVTRDPQAGMVRINESSRFAAPNMGAFHALAVFTDEHLADDYLEHEAAGMGLEKVEIPGPRALRAVLGPARTKYPYILTDPNPRTHAGRPMPIDELLPQLDRWIAEADSRGRT